MHKFKFAAYTFLCGFVVAGFSTMAQYPIQLRIMTYNINAEARSDGDYTDIADVINEINPTVCGLQEVDSCSNAANKVDVLKLLGERTNMVNTFSASYQKNGGSYGNGFLSDSFPINTRRLALHKEETGAAEDHSALEISIKVNGEIIRFIVTQLDYSDPAVQTAELEMMIPWLYESFCGCGPVVIMGDFNAKDTAEPMKLLTEAGFVFVKGKNGKLLDTGTSQGVSHILYYPEWRWRIKDSGNPDYAASDRNPVWADMELLDMADTIVLTTAKKNKKSFTLSLYSRGFIQYDLTALANVSLHIYGISGARALRVLDNTRQGAGRYPVPIVGNRFSRGVYYAVLTIEERSPMGSTRDCRRMIYPVTVIH